MADKSQPQDDLSIEEIRDSIRRILADDEGDADSASPLDEHNIISQDAEDEEPLALTHKIDQDGTIIEMTPPAEELPAEEAPVEETPREETMAFEPENDDSFALAFNEDPTPEIQIDEPPLLAQETFEETPVMVRLEEEAVSPDNLLSSTAAEATSAVMAKLARHTAISNEGQSGVTIEAMVRDLLKPMLREWLDSNLPGLVNEIVEREIEKLTKRL